MADRRHIGLTFRLSSMTVVLACASSCGANVVVDVTPTGSGGATASGTTTSSTATSASSGVVCGEQTCASDEMCCVAGCGTCAPTVTGACTLLSDCGG